MLPSKEEILERTNKGLDIILRYYPEAEKCLGKKNIPFKYRKGERTASAFLKELGKNGQARWQIKDFGSGDAMDCFAVVMQEEGCDFHDAVKTICNMFGLVNQEQLEKEIKPEFSSRAKTPEEKVGEFIFNYKADWEEANLKHIFSRKVLEGAKSDWKKNNLNKDLNLDEAYQPLVKVLTKYGFHAVNWYEKVREDGSVLKISATELYPIFTREEQGFKKILQPTAPNKAHRFQYIGSPPENLMCGYTQLCDEYRKVQEEWEELEEDERKGKSGKIPVAIICTGERDAANVAACGYPVIWFNSESVLLSGKQYGSLMQKVDKLCYCGDIDATGLKQAHALAMTYLNIHIIELPSWLRKKRDIRGNNKKDVRDYLDLCSRKQFDKLVDAALPYQFWDESYTKNGINYHFNNVCAYNFLEKNGYLLHKSLADKEGNFFIKKTSNVVTRIKWNEAARFLNEFLKQRKAENLRLRNFFYKTNQLSESSLRNLSEVEFDFTDFTVNSQLMFFQNEDWNITRHGIQQQPKGTHRSHVWEDEVLPYNVEVLPQPFTITEKEGRWHVEFHDKSCLYLRFLINTCRMHWQVERERLQGKSDAYRKDYLEKNKYSLDGDLLKADEVAEHMHHFVNRIYSIGYLLHRYKSPSKPYAVWAMENKVEREGESSGGSGKSMTFSELKHFIKTKNVPARDPKKTEDKHIYDGVDKNTDLIVVDDCHEFLNFGFFFNDITGTMRVNNKFGSAFDLDFEDAPKMVFTSNYAVRKLDGSTNRRLIFNLFSDYYHNNKEERYESEYKPKMDLGKDLFKDFDENEWNLAANTIARCIQFYMQQEDKINPPLQEVKKRGLRADIGEAFIIWADGFFKPYELEEDKPAGYTDQLIPRSFAMNDFKQQAQVNNWNVRRFSDAIKKYCELNRLILNPKELLNQQGRVSRKWIPPKQTAQKSEDFIYLQTPGVEVDMENHFAQGVPPEDYRSLPKIEEHPNF